ncbi:hypothetical protein [Nostoc sp.]|uniref:hypothetical protein n=1 Tax=Nostoc sp. TaxID=1180 RepID=UPI002FFCE45F
MKHIRYLENLNTIRNSSNQFIYLSLRLLVLSIISVSFLLAGCKNEDENKTMEKKYQYLRNKQKSILSLKFRLKGTTFQSIKPFLNLLRNQQLNMVHFHQFLEHKDVIVTILREIVKFSLKQLLMLFIAMAFKTTAMVCLALKLGGMLERSLLFALMGTSN